MEKDFGDARKRVIGLTKNMVELMETCGAHTGRNPIQLVVAAAYELPNLPTPHFIPFSPLSLFWSHLLCYVPAFYPLAVAPRPHDFVKTRVFSRRRLRLLSKLNKLRLLSRCLQCTFRYLATVSYKRSEVTDDSDPLLKKQISRKMPELAKMFGVGSGILRQRESEIKTVLLRLASYTFCIATQLSYDRCYARVDGAAPTG
jgi:magnesium-transporting ATPase (P-type)